MQSLIFAIPDFKLFHPILHVLLMQSCHGNAVVQHKTKGKQISQIKRKLPIRGLYRPRVIRLFLIQ